MSHANGDDSSQRNMLLTLTLAQLQSQLVSDFGSMRSELPPVMNYMLVTLLSGNPFGN